MHEKTLEKTDMEMIREKIQNLIREMSRGAYEREEVIALSLLSAFAGESIFLLGLPGVGKSMVARRLKSAFKDSTCFEYLMSRFSTPDEIFGPVSISKLKDSDTYERSIDGYLPSADVVFLDEIWKAGPAIQNSLLTALNEKIFHNGKKDISLPLKGIIAASNELPAEGEGLEALWDRFLIRYIVQPISDKGAFMKLIGGERNVFSMPEGLALSDEEYNALTEQMQSVTVPMRVMEALYELRSLYAKRYANREEEEDEADSYPYISDRRWKKIVGILRASAFLNGRNEVDISDCLLLEHMLWDKDDQIGVVNKDVAEMVVSASVKMNLSKGSARTPIEQICTADGGSSYIILAGREELLISKDDYQRLESGEVTYGRFASSNRIIVSDGAGDFRLKCEKPGTVTINTFCYQLKKLTVKGNVTVEDYLATPDYLNKLISENIFLRPQIDDYPYVNVVAGRFKGFRK